METFKLVNLHHAKQFRDFEAASACIRRLPMNGQSLDAKGDTSLHGPCTTAYCLPRSLVPLFYNSFHRSSESLQNDSMV